MPAGHHAKRCHARAEGKGRNIGRSTPLRRSQCSRRKSPESHRDVAGYKRAVRRAITMAVPPRYEMFIASELGDVDRPRATPMLLENDISHYAWRQNHRGNEKNDRSARHQQSAPRQNEFDHKRADGRGHQQRRDPHAEIACPNQRRLKTQRKHIVIGGLDCMKMPGDAQIEFKRPKRMPATTTIASAQMRPVRFMRVSSSRGTQK
jgi:hypothetical protein